MTLRTAIVFEKKPRWTPELQRQFADDEIRVRACTAVSDIDALLAQTNEAIEQQAGVSQRGQAVLVLDFANSPRDSLQYLGRHLGRGLQCAVVLVASKRTAALEWPARELGALQFVTETISGEMLAQLCRRQCS
jgi:hypothetical protein